jgi:hypothetical protein
MRVKSSVRAGAYLTIAAGGGNGVTTVTCPKSDAPTQ